MKKVIVCIMSMLLLTVLAACENKAAEGGGQSAVTESMAVPAGTGETNTENIDTADTNAGDANTADTNIGEINTADTDISETNTTDSGIRDADTAQIDGETEYMEDRMKITVGSTTFTAALADNSSAEALKELLAAEPLTIHMSDYAGMEKVGPIGTSLPRNDEQITTGAGDIILYQGDSLVIYYGTNAWNLTRIGKINDVTQAELLEALGEGAVTVTFSLD